MLKASTTYFVPNIISSKQKIINAQNKNPKKLGQNLFWWYNQWCQYHHNGIDVILFGLTTLDILFGKHTAPPPMGRVAPRVVKRLIRVRQQQNVTTADRSVYTLMDYYHSVMRWNISFCCDKFNSGSRGSISPLSLGCHTADLPHVHNTWIIIT